MTLGCFLSMRFENVKNVIVKTDPENISSERIITYTTVTLSRRTNYDRIVKKKFPFSNIDEYSPSHPDGLDF